MHCTPARYLIPGIVLLQFTSFTGLSLMRIMLEKCNVKNFLSPSDSLVLDLPVLLLLLSIFTYIYILVTNSHKYHNLVGRPCQFFRSSSCYWVAGGSRIVWMNCSATSCTSRVFLLLGPPSPQPDTPHSLAHFLTVPYCYTLCQK
jgi:hypothetical protein